MSKLLTKDEILHETLSMLVRGYGKAAVVSALEDLDRASGVTRKRSKGKREAEEPDAVKFVDSQMPFPHGDLIRRFAQDYDRGNALPRRSDIRRFLLDHRIEPDELRSRNQAFRKMLPLLRGMSEKGLVRLINRARFSGPAQLDEISDAIKGTGSELRRLQLD